MAKKLELSDPVIAALMRQQKRLIPWRSATYNDESTLIELRAAHPKTRWPKMLDMFNKTVPPKRNRSMDGIKNKWRSLQAKVAVESTVEDTNTMQTAPATQMHEEHLNNEDKSFDLQAASAMNPSCVAEVDSQYICSVEDQSTMSLGSLNQHFAEYYEMLSTHWDGMMEFEGYQASIANELERIEAARTVAIEAASGWSEGNQW